MRTTTVPYRAASRRRPGLAWLAAVLLAAACALPAGAATPVTRLELRLVTGADPAAAGASVELRIRESGRAERRLPLAGGGAWPANSTRIVPLTLADPLDPDAVTRLGIAFRGAEGPAPDVWEVASAEVWAVDGPRRVRLLDATIRGLLRGEGELSTGERGAATATCRADADCDDGRSCNGRERCAPRAAGADPRGCVAGVPLACPTNEVCIEGEGCRGPGGAPGGVGGSANGTANAGPAGTAFGPGATGAGAADPGPPAGAGSRWEPPLQACAGDDVLLTAADGSRRRATCPAGTRCVSQPNGTGVCAPTTR